MLLPINIASKRLFLTPRQWLVQCSDLPDSVAPTSSEVTMRLVGELSLFGAAFIASFTYGPTLVLRIERSLAVAPIARQARSLADLLARLIRKN
jgi:hypothetical protein